MSLTRGIIDSIRQTHWIMKHFFVVAKCLEKLILFSKILGDTGQTNRFSTFKLHLRPFTISHVKIDIPYCSLSTLYMCPSEFVS